MKSVSRWLEWSPKNGEMNESDNGGEEEVHPATGLRDRDFFRASCLNGFDLSGLKFSSWDVSVVDLGSEYLVVALHGD